MSFETWQAKKLLEYGFWHRHGAAILSPGTDTGILPNPELFNRSHHPYPIMWVYTLLYTFAGAAGGAALAMLLRLAASVLTFCALDRHFDRFSAWCGAVLVTLAPVTLHLDSEVTNATTIAAVLWPLGAYLLSREKTESPTSPLPGRFIGLSVFLAVQTDWFPLTIVPALIVLAVEWQRLSFRKLADPLKHPVAGRILVAAVLTSALFLLGVIYYEADFGGLHHHVRMEAGGTGGAHSRWWKVLGLVPLRSVMFVGLPLILGSVVGLFHRRQNRSPLVLASLVYFVCWGLSALALPQYFINETSIYAYALFPAAVLTALAIQHRQRFLPWVLIALCLPGMAEIYLYDSIPALSDTSRVIGEFIASHSVATDVVLTNLEPGRRPFKPSDTSAGRAVRVAGDRRIFFGIRTPAELDEIPQMIRQTNAPTLFVVDPACAITPELREQLQRATLVHTATLALPVAKPSLAERIRAFVFYDIMHKGKAETASGQDDSKQETLEIYRLR
ncbi:MAG: hypothetical protein EPO07_17425 [Verrucomicrobia bacterium]|nr:MAG: hypothetical protein EPO07_17425 [Verrucomicrobiota bacterium]